MAQAQEVTAAITEEAVQELIDKTKQLHGSHTIKAVTDTNGVHGIRYNDDVLQVYVDDDWEDVSGGGQLSRSTVTVYTSDANLYNATVTFAINGTTQTGTFGSPGEPLVFKTKEIGTATVTAVGSVYSDTETVDLTTYKKTSVEMISEHSSLTVTTEDEDLIGGTVTFSLDGETQTATMPNTGSVTFNTQKQGSATVSVVNGTYSASDTVNMSVYDDYTLEVASGDLYTISLSTSEATLYGKTITGTFGARTKTAVFSNLGTATIKIYGYTGTATFTASDGTDTAESSITITSGISTYSVALSFAQIYGAEWDGSSSSAFSRTDAAASFTDPSPAVNNGNGSSPFDTISPWKDMVKETDANAGTLVKIPKYYYKWTRNGSKMKLQISSKTFDGAFVSPAHADRGDGKGERDWAYIGRYHCGTSTYKSTTGVNPQVSTTRANFRTSIHNLGSDIWQNDFAMFWTIMMLYLVEYADWNTQAKIGYGCSDSGSVQNSGLTDSMQYHTGTNAANRTTYGHTQYRYIEDLWGNVYDWCDGIYFSGANVYCIKNPADFSDTTGGTLVGTRATSGGFISGWTSPSATGFEYALYPNAVSGSDSTYVCDYCNYDASGVVLRVGGYYYQNQGYGAFFLYGNDAASYSVANIGSRLQKLP